MFNTIPNIPGDTTVCFHDKKTPLKKDDAHIMAVGMSHYHKDENGLVTQSYLQIHQTMYCSTHQKAVQAAHARVDLHATMPHGEFNKQLHNPVDEYADGLVQGAIEYHPTTVAWSSLPQVDVITGQAITNDVYVPHVDHSSRGMCYQDVLLQSRGLNASLDTMTQGCATLENAVELSHRIVDMLDAAYNGEKV